MAMSASNDDIEWCNAQNLAAMKTYTNLEVSLKQANEHRTEYFEGVLNCNLDETLGTVMARIAKAEVRARDPLGKCGDAGRLVHDVCMCAGASTGGGG